MYKTSRIKPETLGRIKVKRQKKIEEITGSRLDPKKAWEVIRNETKDFTKDSEKAKEADELLAELLKANGISVGKSKKEDEQRIRIRERERARAIEIMKLKLKIAA